MDRIPELTRPKGRLNLRMPMPTRKPSPRLRIILFILGLLIICCALVALGFVLWPLPDTNLQVTLPATLLTPP